MLIGNKCDDKTNREISIEEGQQVIIILIITQINNYLFSNNLFISYKRQFHPTLWLKNISSTLIIVDDHTCFYFKDSRSVWISIF